MTSKQLLSKLKHDKTYTKYINVLEKDLEVLEMLKTHFKVNGFDKLIPNGEWFDLPFKDRNKIFKEFGDDK